VAIISKLNKINQGLIYLRSSHCIGRSENNANTVVSGSEISRIHVVIEWDGRCWFIKDVSNNGTLVNGTRLIKNEHQKINVGDEFHLATIKNEGFIVEDVSPPANLLVPVLCDNKIKPIILTDFNLLPTEESPELSLFYVDSCDQWYKEYLNDNESRAYPISASDLIILGGIQWRMEIMTDEEVTVLMYKHKVLSNKVQYRFNLSDDLRDTKLTITTEDETIELEDKEHHRLTLSLAKHRFNDVKKGFSADDQGWRFRTSLASELGIDITSLNAQLCHAKQQFRKHVGEYYDGDELIERKGNKIRFSGIDYRIYRGSGLIIDNNDKKPTLFVMNS